MIFESKQIVYSLEDNWDELVSVTFVNNCIGRKIVNI